MHDRNLEELCARTCAPPVSVKSGLSMVNSRSGGRRSHGLCGFIDPAHEQWQTLQHSGDAHHRNVG